MSCKKNLQSYGFQCVDIELFNLDNLQQDQIWSMTAIDVPFLRTSTLLKIMGFDEYIFGLTANAIFHFGVERLHELRFFQSIFGVSASTCDEIWTYINMKSKGTFRYFTLLWVLYFPKGYRMEERNFVVFGMTEIVAWMDLKLIDAVLNFLLVCRLL